MLCGGLVLMLCGGLVLMPCGGVSIDAVWWC